MALGTLMCKEDDRKARVIADDDDVTGNDDDDDSVPGLTDDPGPCEDDVNSGLVAAYDSRIAAAPADLAGMTAAFVEVLNDVYGFESGEPPAGIGDALENAAGAQAEGGMLFPLADLLAFLALQDARFDADQLLLHLQDYDRNAQRSLCNPAGLPVLLVAGVPAEPNASLLEMNTAVDPFQALVLGIWRSGIPPDVPPGMPRLGGSPFGDGCAVTGTTLAACGAAVEEIVARRNGMAGLAEMMRVATATGSVVDAATPDARVALGACTLRAFSAFLTAAVDEAALLSASRAAADAAWQACGNEPLEAVPGEPVVVEAYEAAYASLQALRTERNARVGECQHEIDTCDALPVTGGGCIEGQFGFTAVVGPLCEGFGTVNAHCVSGPVDDGTPCSDGNPCTASGEVCLSGGCRPGINPCDEETESCVAVTALDYDCQPVANDDDDDDDTTGDDTEDDTGDDTTTDEPAGPEEDFIGRWSGGEVTVFTEITQPDGKKSSKLEELNFFLVALSDPIVLGELLRGRIHPRSNAATGCGPDVGINCINLSNFVIAGASGTLINFNGIPADGITTGTGWMRLRNALTLEGRLDLEYDIAGTHYKSTFRWTDLLRE